MARLATAYSHFKPYDPDLARQQELRELAVAIANKHARGVFQISVGVDVHCEEGSWRTWALVIGGLYAGIAEYGSFREGVDRIVKDARWFSELVNNELINSGNVPRARVFRTERRVETPGRILRTLDEAEHGGLRIALPPVHIGDRRDERTPPEPSPVALRAGDRERRRVLNILRDLNQDEQDAFFASLPKEQISRKMELELRDEAGKGQPSLGRILETDREGTPTLIVGPDGKGKRLPKLPKL